MAVTAWIVGGRTRDSLGGEPFSDREDPVSGEELGEDPLDYLGDRLVDGECVEPFPVGGLGRVGVRPRVDEPVPGRLAWKLMVTMKEKQMPEVGDETADLVATVLFDGELLRQYENLLERDSEEGAALEQSIERVLGIPIVGNAKTDVTEVWRLAEKQLAEQYSAHDETRRMARSFAASIRPAISS